MVMKMNNQERIAHLKAKDYQKYLGVKKKTFDVMLQIMEEDYQRKHRKGGRPPKLRSCTNRLKPFQQSMKSSNNTNSLGRTNRYLIIFEKPAGIVEPGQGTFNNPPLGQDLPFGFYACGNINTQTQFSGNILLKRLAVSRIGTEPLNGWIFLKGFSCCQNT